MIEAVGNKCKLKNIRTFHYSLLTLKKGQRHGAIPSEGGQMDHFRDKDNGSLD